jgi:hypothetical protein
VQPPASFAPLPAAVPAPVAPSPAPAATLLDATATETPNVAPPAARKIKITLSQHAAIK